MSYDESTLLILMVIQMALKVCKHCGSQYEGKKSQVYCSPECSIKSRIKVGDEKECWPWLGSASRGYGYFVFGNKSRKVVRAVMNAPDNLDVLHSCDNPICCNPAHLSLGTHTDNMREMLARGRRNQRGERASRATLTNKQVAEIKSLLGVVRQVDLAAKFNVKRSVIADISAGRSWNRG